MTSNKLGVMIDTLWRLREKKRKAQAAIEEIEKEMDEVERAVRRHMDEEKITASRGSKASLALEESVVPQMESPESWDKFYQYLHKTKQYHLLERRLSVTGCRELFEQGVTIPGVVPFTKRKIILRTINKE